MIVDATSERRDAMAMMILYLTDDMKRWVDDEAAERGYDDPGEVIREIIRREQARQRKIMDMQRLVDEARAEPTVDLTMDEILK